MLLLPSLITNIVQLGRGRDVGRLIGRLWPMLLMIIITTLMSSHWLAGGDSSRTLLALGVALVVYALWTLSGKILHITPRLERGLSPFIGVLTGLLTGGTGVFVIPAVPWLQAIGLEKDDLVQALGISFTCSTLALGAGLWWHGAFHLNAFAASALALIPALTGLLLGQQLRRRLSLLHFRRCFLLSLVALGMEMIWRAI